MNIFSNQININLQTFLVVINWKVKSGRLSESESHILQINSGHNWHVNKLGKLPERFVHLHTTAYIFKIFLCCDNLGNVKYWSNTWNCRELTNASLTIEPRWSAIASIISHISIGLTFSQFDGRNSQQLRGETFQLVTILQLNHEKW